MMYIAMDILKDNSLAEEAVQDATIIFLKKINDIDEIVCRKTYGLVVIVIRRVSLNKLKYENRRNHESDKIFEYTSFEDKLIDEIALDNIIFDEIIAQLKLLNKIDFEIIVLKYYYGYSYNEIASRINLSASAIQKRCERGRKRILKNASRKKMLL